MGYTLSFHELSDLDKETAIDGAVGYLQYEDGTPITNRGEIAQFFEDAGTQFNAYGEEV